MTRQVYPKTGYTMRTNNIRDDACMRFHIHGQYKWKPVQKTPKIKKWIPRINAARKICRFVIAVKKCDETVVRPNAKNPADKFAGVGFNPDNYTHTRIYSDKNSHIGKTAWLYSLKPLRTVQSWMEYSILLPLIYPMAYRSMKLILWVFGILSPVDFAFN